MTEMRRNFEGYLQQLQQRRARIDARRAEVSG
jgi:hypothetical protein